MATVWDQHINQPKARTSTHKVPNMHPSPLVCICCVCLSLCSQTIHQNVHYLTRCVPSDVAGVCWCQSPAHIGQRHLILLEQVASPLQVDKPNLFNWSVYSLYWFHLKCCTVLLTLKHEIEVHFLLPKAEKKRKKRKCNESQYLKRKNAAYCMVKMAAGAPFSFESQQCFDSRHTDSSDMGEDCTQDLGFNSSFIIHPRLAQASQKI